MLLTKGLYHQVFNGLIQDWVEADAGEYDLAVFGDVLEHLSVHEIRKVVGKCFKKFKYIIIQVPLHEIFQDGGYEIPLETHRSYITANFFNRYAVTEKHIISEMTRPIGLGRRWLIMNVCILCNAPKISTIRELSYWAYHFSMALLQKIGFAAPFIKFLRPIKRRINSGSKMNISQNQTKN